MEPQGAQGFAGVADAGRVGGEPGVVVHEQVVLELPRAREARTVTNGTPVIAGKTVALRCTVQVVQVNRDFGRPVADGVGVDLVVEADQQRFVVTRHDARAGEGPVVPPDGLGGQLRVEGVQRLLDVDGVELLRCGSGPGLVRIASGFARTRVEAGFGAQRSHGLFGDGHRQRHHPGRGGGSRGRILCMGQTPGPGGDQASSGACRAQLYGLPPVQPRPFVLGGVRHFMAPELVCGARSGECRFPAAWAG